MTISQWPDQRADEAAMLREQLGQMANELEVVTEAWVDAEFAAEDRGWVKLGAEMEAALSRNGLKAIVRNSRLMSVVSPLLKRGLTLRIAYVFGQGVEIAARDEEVNAVVQDFLDDPSNQVSFASPQAREAHERTAGTDGNVLLALFTSPLTGRVQVRLVPFDEIQDVITNPDDRDEPWFYLREYATTVVEQGYARTRSRRVVRREFHPALGFRPVQRPTSLDGIPIRWDAPIDHTHVNRVAGTKWGIPDAYAALAWARAYEGFLTDWARLVKALSRFAWRLSGDKGSRAQRAVAALREKLPAAENGTPGNGTAAGGVAATGPGTTLEAIPKSGATIDSDSGKPLAAMVAASLGVSVVNLLADPGTTGARAVAETLDKPTILEANQRRELWGATYQRVLTYVITQAVKAPNGPLAGKVLRDEYGRERIDLGMTTPLAGQQPTERDARVEITWPDLNELDPKSLVEAIVRASETEKLPGEVIAKLLLAALPVKDVDEIIDAMRDEQGNWTDPGLDAAAAAIARHRNGQDTGLPAGDPTD